MFSMPDVSENVVTWEGPWPRCEQSPLEVVLFKCLFDLPTAEWQTTPKTLWLPSSVHQDSGKAQPGISSAQQDAGWDHRIPVRGLPPTCVSLEGALQSRDPTLSLLLASSGMRGFWEELQQKLQIMAQLWKLHSIFLLHSLGLARFKGRKIDSVSQSQE